MELNRRDVILASAAALMPMSSVRGATTRGGDIWLPPAWYHEEALRVSWHRLRDIDGGMNGEDFNIAPSAHARWAVHCQHPMLTGARPCRRHPLEKRS